MNLDPLAIRNLLVWVALAVGSTVLLGGVPSWMRGGAKSADPSTAAAVFALVFTLASAALLYLSGVWEQLLSLTTMQILWLGVCGLLSALTWLSLFTALTGGKVSKVIPVFLLSSLLTLAASHFLFGAPMGLWKICCMVLMLLGVVFIESKTQQLQGQLWFVYALIAAFATTGAELVSRGFLLETLHSQIYQAGRAAFATVFLWIFVFARGKQSMLKYVQARAWFSIVFAALFFAGSFAATYYASRRGEMSTLAPLSILSFLFAMLFARIFQKERQPGSTIFGTLLVLLGQFGILMGF